MTLLEVDDVVAGYGSHTVLHGVSLTVAAGEAVTLLGLNGAGKSVTLRCVSGLLTPWSGRVSFDGHDVTRATAEARVALGVAMVPQGRGIFPDLSVEQNLRLGGYRLSNAVYRARREPIVGRFPILEGRAAQLAGALSGGEQAMLAVGRALLGEPRLLILDEPTAGLSPAATAIVLRLLQDLRDEGLTILLVEQNVGFGLALAHRALLMQKGRVLREAEPGKLTDRTALLQALGAGALHRAPGRRPRPLRARR